MRIPKKLSMIVCVALATSVAIGGDTPLLGELIGGIEDQAGEFFGWAANTTYRGFGLTLEMSDEGPDAEIRRIAITVPEPLEVREMADALKRRLPGVRHRASHDAPELKKQDNPSPGYVLCEECIEHLLFKPQLVWIQGGRGRRRLTAGAGQPPDSPTCNTITCVIAWPRLTRAVSSAG